MLERTEQIEVEVIEGNSQLKCRSALDGGVENEGKKVRKWSNVLKTLSMQWLCLI